MEPQNDEVDLIGYIRVVYKHRFWVMGLVLANMLFAGIVNLRKPLMYEASATFFPLNVKSYKFSGEEDQGSLVSTNGMSRRLDIENLIISIMESRKMADRIIEQHKLMDLWKTGTKVAAQRILGGAANITLGKNGIIKLSVKDKNPEFAAKIANAFVDNLEYFNRELNIGADRQIVQVIDRATVPEERMARGTVKKTLVAGTVAFVLGVFMSFIIEFFKKTDIIKRLREE